MQGVTRPSLEFAHERARAEVLPGLGASAAEDASLVRHISDLVVQYPLPSHWKSITTPSGDVYYWNKVTDQTTWNHPLADAAGELLDAVKNCRAAGFAAIGGSVARDNAKKRQMACWTQRWHEAACRQLDCWRSVGGEVPGSRTYYYRVPPSSVGSSASLSSTNEPTTTWEDPRAALELRLRFQSDTLASLLALPVPDLQDAVACPRRSGSPSASRPRAPASVVGTGGAAVLPPLVAPAADIRASPRRKRPDGLAKQRKRTCDGQLFSVEELPADHSCGFHGLGITRELAASLLYQHRGDPDVQEFVAADLAAALQTVERSTFPSEIRGDERLWNALDAYYKAQQALDDKGRQAREFMAECRGPGRADEDVGKALVALERELKEITVQAPSGPSKTQLMQRYGRSKTQVKEHAAAEAALSEAWQALRRLSRARIAEYISWVGSDSSFWLSFVRGCGDDKGGGLLDALAKVRGLTVRVWAETTDIAGLPGGERRLELVHEAAFGGRGGQTVNLWFQSIRGHYDRLVPCEPGDSGARA